MAKASDFAIESTSPMMGEVPHPSGDSREDAPRGLFRSPGPPSSMTPSERAQMPMDRPTLIERREYRPGLPVEGFIVPLLKAKIENVLETLPANAPGYKVLDVGCGGQPFRSFFDARRHAYISVDAQDPLGIVDHVAEIDKDLPPALMARGPFDFILCAEVLEHVADWDKAFANFQRLLASGGRILITCPHFYVLHEQPYDFWRPTVYALSFFAERYGLQPLSMEKVGTSWDVLGTLLGANYNNLRPLQNRLLDKMAARLGRAVLKLTYLALRRRVFQTRFAFGGDPYPIYLANVALLEKR
jgi:SAM-dependent methyltransferase